MSCTIAISPSPFNVWATKVPEPDDLPSYTGMVSTLQWWEHKKLSMPQKVHQNGSETKKTKEESKKKTQMELWNDLQQAMQKCDGRLRYEALEKLYISAMESKNWTEASHFLEDLEEIESTTPSLRGRTHTLIKRFVDETALLEMDLIEDSPTILLSPCYWYDTSDEEESLDVDEDDLVEIKEPRWCEVRNLTPVHKNSELVNNVPEGYEVRLTGKVKGTQVQIDHPYRGWISTDNLRQKVALPKRFVTRSTAVSPMLPSSPAMSMARTVSASLSPQIFVSPAPASSALPVLCGDVKEMSVPPPAVKDNEMYVLPTPANSPLAISPMSPMESLDKLMRAFEKLEEQVQLLMRAVE